MKPAPHHGPEGPPPRNPVSRPAKKVHKVPRQHLLTRFALIGTIVLSVLLAGGFVIHDHAVWRKTKKEDLAHYAEHVRQSTEAYFSRYESLLRAIGEADCMQNGDGNSCNALLSRVKEYYPQVVNFGAVNSDGRVFASSRPFGPEGPPDVSELPFFPPLAAGASRFVTDPHVGPISGKKVIGFMVPLPARQDRFAGIVGMSIELAELSQVWATAPLHPDFRLAIINRGGTIIFASEGFPLPEGTSIGWIADVPGSEGTAEKQATVRLAGHEYLAWQEGVPIAEWTLFAAAPSTGFLGGYLNHSSMIWGMGLAIGLLATTGMLLSRREGYYYRRLYASEERLRRHRDQLEIQVEARTAELAASEARYRQIVETAREGILVVNGEGKTAFVNQKMADMLGWPVAALVDKPLSAFMDEESAKTVETYLRCRRQDRYEQQDFRFRRRDGSVFWALLAASPLLDDADGYVGALAMVTDITTRRQIEQDLRNSRQLLTLILDSLPTRIFWKDLDLNYLGANQAFAQDAGLASPKALIGKNDFDLVGTEAAERFRAEDRFVIESGEALMHVDGLLTLASGRAAWLRTSKLPLLEADGKIVGVIGTYEDITAQKENQEQLQHLATHDVLTGLANRALLQDRLEQSIHFARRSGRVVAVLLLDLDRFKVINDSLGHDFGDQLLCTLAERLQKSVREADTVARMGGDEFVILLAEVAEPDDVGLVATKILRNLAEPLSLAGREITMTASLGISVFPRDSADASTLLRNADIAMYRAKKNERNTFAFYSPEMNQHILEILEMESALRLALERGEFSLHYQPKVDLDSGRIVGCEALVRWLHPQKGMVPPAHFIPLAEETSLIVPLGNWVIQEACRQTREWQDQGLPVPSVAVNLSARQFRKGNLQQVVQEALLASGLEPGLLELELTESMVMDDPAGAEQTMLALKKLGVGLSLDDFGTGYSSLNYLRRFPVDSLKIDRSFIRDVTIDPSGDSVVTSVINIAHNLGLTVVAEGVETRDQFAFLASYGCDMFQGYLFSKPLPAEEFASLLRRGQTFMPANPDQTVSRD